MLKTYAGGNAVPSGSYWNASTGDWATLGEEGGVLPVSPSGRYIRVAPWVMLLLGPTLGLLYFLFLPIAVLGVLAQFVAIRLTRGIRAAWRAIIHVQAHRSWRLPR